MLNGLTALWSTLVAEICGKEHEVVGTGMITSEFVRLQIFSSCCTSCRNSRERLEHVVFLCTLLHRKRLTLNLNDRRRVSNHLRNNASID